MIRCSMTGLPMNVGDGIYDDGEWISWDWINGHLSTPSRVTTPIAQYAGGLSRFPGTQMLGEAMSQARTTAGCVLNAMANSSPRPNCHL